MRLGYPLDYAGDPRAAADGVAALERAGLDVVWVAEAYGFDAPTLMGYLAARTDRVQIAAGILNVYSRTPAAILQTAAGLDNVSQGRAILGLGASGPQVIEGFHGVPYTQPLRRIRETIDVVRAGLRRERLSYTGRTVTLPLPPGTGTGLGKPLKLLTRPVRDRVPIYVAALGEKSVQTTAEIADGWLPFLFAPERANAVWGNALRAGAALRDPSLGALDIAAGGLLYLGDDPVAQQRALDAARPNAALYVGGMGAKNANFYHELVSRYGFAEQADHIQQLYLGGRHRDAAAAVPEELLRMTNLVGDRAQLAERVAAYRNAGVTILNVAPAPGTDPVDQLRQMRELVDGSPG
ncbi:LLM class F420-dependent oxidoreductase [Nakamurella aerolata]|uniref:LLM class F420-dependent oxidoreductase n=1 Tax=Nakamurella aerolata TaxID=1656892 RepID=A0A849AE50_9ACTN|nr:LLM class F420-dependent oxidoreductase [Nakamurella aerolata]NNG35142.1 LLM class F420-dependent oxidoreductase [Nakamurella aerolata]